MVIDNNLLYSVSDVGAGPSATMYCMLISTGSISSLLDSSLSVMLTRNPSLCIAWGYVMVVDRLRHQHHTATHARLTDLSLEANSMARVNMCEHHLIEASSLLYIYTGIPALKESAQKI